MGKFVDLTGQTFGRLTVLNRAADHICKNGVKKVQWLCLCSCGKQKVVKGSDLKCGHIKSCGCMKSETPNNFVDLTGLRFGKLLVLNREKTEIQSSKQCKTMWRCKCDCGNEVVVAATHLKSGHSQTCGCGIREARIKSGKKYNDYEVQEDYVIMYTRNGYPFYVDLDDFWKVKDVCWHMDNGYILGLIGRKRVQLHRFIMDCLPELYVDHIGGSETRNDNRKYNLRIVTMAQNCMNSHLRSTNKSGVTGVGWNEQHKKWHARMKINGEVVLSEFYDNFEDAVKARKEAEEKYHQIYSYDNSQKIWRENNV